MLLRHNLHNGVHGHCFQGNPVRDGNRLKAIAYSMDALVPGFYLWVGKLRFQIGGCTAEESYPGTLHSFWGIGLVLPGYRIYSTYNGSYDA